MGKVDGAASAPSKSAPPPEIGVPFPPPPMAYVQPPQPPQQQQGIPVQQSPLQAMQALNTVPAGAWSTGLCDCFSDCSNCCMTCCCPCVTFGRIAEIVDQGNASCGITGALYALIAWTTGCACIYSCFYREKLRKRYMLPEQPLPDCIVHFFCEACALCQEYRELQNRGFDMTLGWNGNVAKQNQGMQMNAPHVQGGMMR